MSAALVRLGLVGCGRLAELGYAPAARAAAGVAIVAVADPDRGRRELLAEQMGANAHAGVEELLDAGPLDGVVICSAPEHHEQGAALVAQAGLAALVEKPPAPDAAGAERLAALAPAPWIGFNRRFDQGLELAGRVPPETALEMELKLRYRRASWRPVARGDDALLDLAPHLVDLVLLLTGARARGIRATAGRDRAELVLETTRGPARVECATDRAHREVVDVRELGGRRVARAVRGGLARGLVSRVRPGPHPLLRSLAAQLEAYGRALRGEDPGPLATAADGAAVMRVLDAARRSAHAGGEPMAVDEVGGQAPPVAAEDPPVPAPGRSGAP